MRILWFTNINLLPVNRKLGINDTVMRGWMDTLRTSLMRFPDVKLGVVSDSDYNYEPFEEDNTTFYNILIPSKTGSIDAVYRRWSNNAGFSNKLIDCMDIIERFKPDLIHIHGSEEFYGLLVKYTSIPVLLSMQGILSVCENVYFNGYSIKDILIDNFSINFLKGTSSLHKFLTIKKAAGREREIIKSCKYFTGRTEFDKNFIQLLKPDSYYFHCDRILRSPFYAAEWNAESCDDLTIYCTTSASPYKGLMCLINAVYLLKTNGFPNIHLKIGGYIKNSNIWGSINKRVNELNLGNHITWLGNVSSEIIVSELIKASIYVMPSFIENSPNSLAEAMLVGTPCVASCVGGVPSYIEHGKDGLLFPAGDYHSLAGMMAKLLRNPSLARSLSENAKLIARKRHDPKEIGTTMRNIYTQIIDN